MNSEAAYPASLKSQRRVVADDTREAALVRHVGRLLTENVHLQVPTPDTDLIGTGLMDSLALVEVLFHLEEEFGVQVGADDLDPENFRSVRSIAAFVARYPS